MSNRLIVADQHVPVRLAVWLEDFVDERGRPIRKECAEHTALELHQQFLAGTDFYVDHPNVREQVGEGISAQVDLQVLPFAGVFLLQFLGQCADHLRLEDVRWREFHTTRFHHRNGSDTRLSSAEKKELAELRRKNRQLELENEISKRLPPISPQESVLPK